MHENVVATDARAILEDIALCGHRTGTKIVFPNELVEFLIGNSDFPGWEKAIFLISEDANLSLFQECLHSRDLYFASHQIRSAREARISDVLTNDFRGKIRLLDENHPEYEEFDKAIRVKPFGNDLVVWTRNQ